MHSRQYCYDALSLSISLSQKLFKKLRCILKIWLRPRGWFIAMIRNNFWTICIWTSSWTTRLWSQSKLLTDSKNPPWRFDSLQWTWLGWRLCSFKIFHHSETQWSIYVYILYILMGWKVEALMFKLCCSQKNALTIVWSSVW